jgi:hypothetical protein
MVGEHVVGDRPEVDPDAPRRDGDEVVGDEVGENDEDRGRRRLLDRLQQQRRALWPEEMELVQDHHLAAALHRRQRRQAHDLAGLVGGDERARPLDLAHVGMLAGKGQAGVPAGGIVATGQEGGGEGPSRLALGRTRWSDEQVRVHRRGDRALQRSHRRGLSNDAVPHARQPWQHAHWCTIAGW